MNLAPEFLSALNRFLDCVREKTKQSSVSDINKPPVIGCSIGPRYIRVFMDNTAYGFIDKTTGDILKPASWRTPSKQIRGNIFKNDYEANCGDYGVLGPKEKLWAIR